MARQRGSRWQADVKVDGKRLRTTFETKEEAEAYEANPQGEQVKPTVEAMFRHGCDLLWTGTKNGSECVRLTEELIRRLGAMTRVNTITTATVQDLQAALLKEGNSRSTVNRKMATLSKLVKHCKSRGALVELPDIRFYPAAKGRIRYLTDKEEAAIFDRLSPHFRALADFLLYTGCRLGEAMALSWADVQSDRVTFWVTKGNKPRTIPLIGRAKTSLNLMRDLGKAKPFGWINYDSFHHAWTEAKAKAGLRDDEQVVPHVLRHTCASRFIMNGADLVAVKEWLGHGDVRQTMQYAHLAPSRLFDIAGLLNQGDPAMQPGLSGGQSDVHPVGVPNGVTLCHTIEAIPSGFPLE